jgi:predicted peptidase
MFRICVLLPLAVCAAPKSDYGKAKPEQAAVIATLEAGLVEAPAQMPWRLFVPAGADPAKPLPLVVFLHGAGMRGTDNVGPMSLAWTFITPEAQAKHPCFVLAGQVRDGRRWVGQDFNKGSYSAAAVTITDEMRAMLALVDRTIASRPIDRTRVYAVGQSMGGYGTWDALIRRPDLWAAGVPICGAGDPSQATAIKTIPVWAWHGASDTAVPVSGSRDMIAALTTAGAKPQYTEIAKGGHGVWGPAFADPKLYEWLFAQRRP